MHGPPLVFIYPTPVELSVGLAQHVVQLSAESIAKHGIFTIAVSGGTLPHHLSRHLKTMIKEVEWSKWHVFFVDERVTVVEKDPNSVYSLLSNALLKDVPIPSENIHALNGEYSDDADLAAEDYIDQMVSVFSRMGKEAKFPVFDLILLGIGEDGHTASLFPNHPLLNENQRWCAAITDSPKPPSERITLTMSVLNHAHNVTFVVTESNKAELLRQVLKEENFHDDILLSRKLSDPVVEDQFARETEGKVEGLIPCLRVRPVHGQVRWFLDSEAGAQVQYPLTEHKV